jgi:hypothetical protein
MHGDIDEKGVATTGARKQKSVSVSGELKWSGRGEGACGPYK